MLNLLLLPLMYIFAQRNFILLIKKSTTSCLVQTAYKLSSLTSKFTDLLEDLKFASDTQPAWLNG